jgi:SpoIIAA-like
MLEILNDLPPGVDGIRAVGTISKEDYETVVAPLFDAARRDGRHVRFLYQCGPDFHGFTPGAAWEDVRIGLRSLRILDGCAVVSDIGWIREGTRVAAFMMPCPVQVFANADRVAAGAWLASLPEGAAVSTRLIPEAGVMVVEVKQPLRAQDFEAMTLTADTWIEAHGRLDGLVIHAREFPGWENIGAFVRHVRFVRDHHRRIGRIALAVDSRLAALAPRIAEVFVKAEVKEFAFGDLDGAIAWAGGKPSAG